MTLERALIVLAVIAIAIIGARLQNRGTAVRRRHRSFVGLEPGVKIFASRSCDQCEAIEALVAEVVGPDSYTVLWWDEVPALFESNEIDRVPAVAHVDGGGGGWIAVGIPNSLRLRRWLGNP